MARLFYTGSTRIISDTSVTATEHRVYACVSLHDGMSLLKGKGAGCFVSNTNLASEVGCDYSTLCKTLSRLVSAGYLLKGNSGDDRRMTVYRVTFPGPDKWQAHHPTSDHKGGEVASQTAEIGGERPSEIDANPPETPSHYIPLKGELDSVETEELDSVETARLYDASLGKNEKKKWIGDNVGAQLGMFERDWKADPSAFTDEQLVEKHRWLFGLSEDGDPSDPNNQRAQRLYYSIDVALWETNRGPYAEGAAA